MKIRGSCSRFAAFAIAVAVLLTSAGTATVFSDSVTGDSSPPGWIPLYTDPSEPLESGTMLFVRTSRPAAVLIDGENRGIAPVLITGLTPGRHNLRVESAALTNRRVLQVDAGMEGVTFYTPAMRPFTGSLRVVSEPATASVYLNGIPAGTTPFTIEGLAVGEYELSVEADGYETISQSVRISDDESTAVAMEMEPAASDGVDARETARVVFSKLLPESHVFFNYNEVTGAITEDSVAADSGLTTITVLTSDRVPFTTVVPLQSGQSFTIELPNTVDPAIAARPRRIIGLSTLVPGALLSAGGLILNLDAIAISVTADYDSYVTVKYASLGAAGTGLLLMGVGVALALVL